MVTKKSRTAATLAFQTHAPDVVVAGEPRSLDVYLNEHKVGALREQNNLWAFDYDPAWAASQDSIDLSPALSRFQASHVDGGTYRPVQWYFDNLLPEQTQRVLLNKEAGIKGDDAFALLAYLGIESAGSLVMVPEGKAPPARGGLQPLPIEELSDRIRHLPSIPLSHGAPKRMSIAGAQDKLPVVLNGDNLYEPVGAEPSTHILKPNHHSVDYPGSVINEYLTMRLAYEMGLKVPFVQRLYVPQPVYIIERFDRYRDDAGVVQRRHIVDACQLLNKSRDVKHSSATLETLAELVGVCSNRASTRLRLYQWLVFNVLVANDDNHLKNLSFNITPQGFELAPGYDMLFTSAYYTRSLANERHTWPDVEMTIKPPGVTTFGQVTRSSLIEAAAILGLPKAIADRELDKYLKYMKPTLDNLIARVTAENNQAPPDARGFFGSENHVMRVMSQLVLPEMLSKASKG